MLRRAAVAALPNLLGVCPARCWMLWSWTSIDQAHVQAESRVLLVEIPGDELRYLRRPSCGLGLAFLEQQNGPEVYCR